MTGNIFIDTNLWIYLHSKDPKKEIVVQLVKQNYSQIVVSVQVLGEMYHALTRKSIKDATEAKNIIHNIAMSFPPVSSIAQ
jgi:predicted nucleic acid-binding protein